MHGTLAWPVLADGVRLCIHLTPKSSRDAVEGLAAQSDGKEVLKVRVRAVPEDGKANTALIETLARALGLPRLRFELENGGKSRTKLLRISGDPQRIDAALRQLLEKPV